MARDCKGYKKPAPGEFILRDGWYWPNKPCVKGHVAPRNQRKHCVQCIREYRKAKGHFSDGTKRWRDQNRAHANAWRREYARRNPAWRMVASAKRTAKVLGVPFNLTPEDISVPTHCPVLGVPLTYGIKGLRARDWSASLDRIVPAIGYVKGNVVVVSWRVNRIKCDASLDDLRKITAFYSRLLRPKPERVPLPLPEVNQLL